MVYGKSIYQRVNDPQMMVHAKQMMVNTCTFFSSKNPSKNGRCHFHYRGTPIAGWFPMENPIFQWVINGW